MNGFGLYGKFTVDDGNRDTLVDILLEAAESMQNLSECELYLVSVSSNEPNSIFVYEVWSNKKAHEDSLSLEATKRLIERAKPIITGMEEISVLEPKGGKGFPN
ncbi:putative quinol monooxygenase [Alkalibacterium sp. 20]|uniref:putative quinol monooxygenase n=1 Tax=Alkalibacterium sp. 20 TaxID=1798803 RepID=UPI0009001C98|nr:putative quinol monooxygenase [Alkalibacterium sp. 20]OJF92728.1 antibiotic biosynthesis monooxygenase [Alkalibacterium sp. 20]